MRSPDRDRSGAAATAIVAGCALSLCTLAANAAPPIAIAIEAPADLRGAISERMSARGFAIEEGASAQASIVARGEVLDVRATDAEGRSAERTLSNLDDAATWIESWVRTDLYQSLLAERRQPIVPRDVSAAEPAERIERAAPAVRSSACPTNVGARAETAVGNDGRPAFGAALNLATELIACFGVEGRVGATQLANASDDRLTAEALVEAGWPIVVGPIDLMPSLGLGFVWQRTVRKQEYQEQTWRPRVELAMSAAWPFAKSAALELAIAWAVAVRAHTDKFYPYGPPPAGTSLNPGDETYQKIENTAIAGEPWFQVRFGVGLRFDLGTGGSE